MSNGDKKKKKVIIIIIILVLKHKKKKQKKKTWSFLIIANLIFTTPTPYCIMDAFGTVSLQDSVGISQ